MAVAATPKPADAAVAETPVVEAAVAPVEAVAPRDFEVTRDFTAHVATQLLSFKVGAVVSGAAGETLYATGAPVKPLS